MHTRFRPVFARVAALSTAPVPKDKIVVTAALNGVLTDPKKFNVPVTPAEMATAAEQVNDCYGRFSLAERFMGVSDWMVWDAC
jgi:hypothetical protein